MSLIQANGNGGRYPYFFCIGRMKGTGGEQPYVPVDLIETAVEDAYGEVAIPAEQADLVREKLDVALTGMREQAEAEVAEPFATLADPELPDRLDGEAVTRTGASSGGGSMRSF